MIVDPRRLVHSLSVGERQRGVLRRPALERDLAVPGEQAEVAEVGADYGAGAPEAPQKIQVELISANPAGPLTVLFFRTSVPLPPLISSA